MNDDTLYIHHSPKFYLPDARPGMVRLKSLSIPELGLNLVEERDLKTGRPYPNKGYFVGGPAFGRKAYDGVLIQANRSLKSFTINLLWELVAGEQVRHEISVSLMESEFQAVSTSLEKLYGTSESLGNWESRWPDHLAELSPLVGSPSVEFIPTEKSIKRPDTVRDTLENGRIVHRKESLLLPTIEPERLNQEFALLGAMPPWDSVFDSTKKPA